MLHARQDLWRLLVALAVASTMACAQAATIVGTLYTDDKPAPPGVVLKLACAGAPPVSGQTDARGGFRLTVAGAGKCRLDVGDAYLEVILSPQTPVQYDFAVQGSGAAATLRRR